MEKIVLNNHGFNVAKAILTDKAFEVVFDRTNKRHQNLWNLYQARKTNIDFNEELADKICGNNLNYPYRSSKYLTKFFRDLEFDYEHDGKTRSVWVEEVLMELSIADIEKVIEQGLFRKKDYNNISFRTEGNQHLSQEEFFKNAVEDFKNFIDQSKSADEGISLNDLMNQNINYDMLMKKSPAIGDNEVNSLIEEAKNRFYKIGDKHIAVEKLWDAFERIKTLFGNGKNKKESANKLIDILAEEQIRDIFNAEFICLTKIGNDYQIRHHETDRIKVDSDLHLNYLFFRMLNLIDLCLISIKRDEE